MPSTTPKSVSKPKEKPLILVVAAALINNQGKILIAKRPKDKAMADMWEFPGGKIEKDETPETALIRELKEELSINVKNIDLSPICFASHEYEDFHLLMPLYLCKKWSGTLTPTEHQKLKFVAPQHLKNYEMPPADIPLIAQIEKLL